MPLRRGSCGILPGKPAAIQARRHAFANVLNRPAIRAREDIRRQDASRLQPVSFVLPRLHDRLIVALKGNRRGGPFFVKWAPVLRIHRTPLSTARLSRHGRLRPSVRRVSPGSKGPITLHCSSLRSRECDAAGRAIRPECPSPHSPSLAPGTRLDPYEVTARSAPAGWARCRPGRNGTTDLHCVLLWYGGGAATRRSSNPVVKGPAVCRVRRDENRRLRIRTARDDRRRRRGRYGRLPLARVPAPAQGTAPPRAQGCRWARAATTGSRRPRPTCGAPRQSRFVRHGPGRRAPGRANRSPGR